MKICIDPGHGGIDPGCKRDKEVLEKYLNLEYAIMLKTELEKYKNVEIILTRNNDSYISLIDRSIISNSNNCDLFISCHLNAFNTNSRGTEVIHSIFAKRDFIELCKNIAINLATNLKIPYRRVFSLRSEKGNYDYYTVINKTNCPAMIIEALFLDNSNDFNRYNPYIISKTISDNIANNYKLELKENNYLYQVISGSYNIKENAELQIEKLKKLGIDSFIEVKRVNI